MYKFHLGVPITMPKPYLKGSFDHIILQLGKRLHVFLFYELISIHSAGFMKPKAHKIDWSFQACRSREQNSLQMVMAFMNICISIKICHFQPMCH